MKLSLEELKRQNAEAEAATQQAQDESDNATDELEEVEEQVEDEAGELEQESDDEPEEDGDLTEGQEEDEDGEGELESWMSEDDNSHDGQGVPVKAHVKMKHKLKGKLEDVKDENYELRQRIAQLEQGIAPQAPQASQPQVNTPARPKRSDFEDEYGILDEDKYDAAVDDWSIKRFQSVQEQQFTETQQTQAQKASLEKQNKAVDTHYERGAELVNAGKVKAETFQKADTNIRRRLEGELPGQGDKAADALIAQISAIAGEKSALVAFKIGAKPEELERVLAGFKEDQAGVGGMREIARIAASIESPVKKKSRAVPPTKQIKGDKGGTPTEAAFKKKVQAARSKGNTQQVISLKREARKNGINTNNW